MLPDLLSPALDYTVVDGLGRAWQRSRPPKLNGAVYRAAVVGPAIELAHLEAGLNFSSLRGESWFDDGSLGPLLGALAAGSRRWLAPDGRQGFVTGAGILDDQILTSFKIDAHKAALAAGYGKAAALLVAALGELIGNVCDHSGAIETGMALFTAQTGRFEFVVADGGIGVLRSLTQNPDYAGFNDEGAALSAIVETGVSRFGRESGHGHGFRPIFERLADMTGHLRFRSGDHALTLDGRFGDRIARQIAQKPRLRGFFASVTSNAPMAAAT